MGSSKGSSINQKSARKKPSFLTQLVIIFKTVLLVLLSVLSPFLISHWFPAIKFFCIDFLPSHCSLLLNYDYQELFRPRNLFLLLNIIILTIFASLHLQQQHTAAHAAARDHQPALHGAKPAQSTEEYSAGDGGESMVAEAHEGDQNTEPTVDPTEFEAREGSSCRQVILPACEEAMVIKDMENTRETMVADMDSTTVGYTEKTEKTHHDNSTGLVVFTPNLHPINHNDAIVLDDDGRLRLINHDKPLPSSRFASRKSVNPSLSGDNPPHQAKGSLLRSVSKRVKKGESLDATWKAINHNISVTNHDHVIKKPNSHPVMAKIRRREPSITQEELNTKVESFIANFNKQIRIQREESLLTYTQMVDRGA